MNRFFNCIIKKHGIRSGQFSCSLFSPASSVNFFSKRYKIPKSKKEKKQHNKEKEAFQSEKTEDTLKFDKFSRQIKPLPDDFKPDKPFSANMDKVRPLPQDTTRMQRMEMPVELMYKASGILNYKKEKSAYFSLPYQNKIYHFFNAQRIPLGRMAGKIAYIIQGKHRPDFKPNIATNNEICVVVNASDPYVTGRTRYRKVYSRHSGYPGGLKQIRMKELISKDPIKLIKWVVRGMLPTNKIRNTYLESVLVYPGPYHDLDSQHLPQFTVGDPEDPNKVLGFDQVTPDKYKLIFSSTSDIPEEYKDFKVDLDNTIGLPKSYREKIKTFNPEHHKARQ